MQRFRTTLVLVAGAGGAWVAGAAGLPVSWLLGPMVGAALAVIALGRPQPLSPRLLLAANAVLGVNSGLLFTLDTVRLLVRTAHLLGAVVLIPLVLCAGLGYLVHRLAGVDRRTALLGMAPGAASAMVGLSHELGADTRLVALIQYLRLTLVVVAVPILVPHLAPVGAGKAAPAAGGATAAAADPAGLLALAACALVGPGLARAARLPSPYFLGPMVLAAVGLWSGLWRAAVPGWLLRAALFAVGVTVGARFDRGTLAHAARVAAVTCALIPALIGLSLGCGLVFARLAGVDLLTALLGSAPGGMETMVAAALDQGAQAPLVVAMHLLRWLAVVVLAPWAAPRLAQGEATRSQGAGGPAAAPGPQESRSA